MILNSQHEQRHKERPARPAMPLDMHQEGDVVKIKDIRGGRGVVQRLKEMGIGVGSLVRIVKNHRPGGLVLEVLDSKLCIGRGVARKIRAEDVEW